MYVVYLISENENASFPKIRARHLRSYSPCVYQFVKKKTFLPCKLLKIVVYRYNKDLNSSKKMQSLYLPMSLRIMSPLNSSPPALATSSKQTSVKCNRKPKVAVGFEIMLELKISVILLTFSQLSFDRKLNACLRNLLVSIMNLSMRHWSIPTHSRPSVIKPHSINTKAFSPGKQCIK